MLILLAALFASSGQQTEVGSRAPLRTQSLHTPDQISPAVLPYLACLYAARGLPLLRGIDGRPISTGEPGAGGDCSTVRERAREQALKLIDGKQLPDNVSPEIFVENTLSEMDSYVASVPPPISQQSTGHLPLVEATQFMMEDEVLPAYTKYSTCLRDKVKESPITAANVVAKFSGALATCRGVRASALKEASEALLKKGWDETACQRAADSTFARADESWTTMGRRIHDALLQREASPNAHGHSNEPK
jgi:hypothetical protein